MPYILDQQRRTAKKGIETSVFSLFNKFKAAQCSEKKDKIFGFLGLADACCRDPIPVNYALSFNHICVMFLNHHMQSHWNSSQTILGTVVELRQLFGESPNEASKHDQELDLDWISGYQDSIPPPICFRRHIKCVIPCPGNIELESLDDLVDKLELLSFEANGLFELFALYAKHVVHEVDENICSQIRSIFNYMDQNTGLDNVKFNIDKMVFEGTSFYNLAYVLLHLFQETAYQSESYIPESSCALFLDETGMIGLGPPGTRVDDKFVMLGETYSGTILREIMVIGSARHLRYTHYNDYVPRFRTILNIRTTVRNLVYFINLLPGGPSQSTALPIPCSDVENDRYWSGVDMHRKDFKAMFEIVQADPITRMHKQDLRDLPRFK